jgi:23S rRNA pseudouridine1911/1915/1917 synthase
VEGERIVELSPEEASGRVDRVLAERLADLSRVRIQALIAEGAVTRDGEPVSDASAKAAPGRYRLIVPPPLPAEPQPEAIPLSVVFEDAHLIVIDKPRPTTSTGSMWR